MWPRSNTGGGEGGLQCLHQDEAEGSWRDRLVTSSKCIEMLNRKTTNFETTFAFIWFSWFQGYQPPASSWEERPVSLSCWKRSCKTYNVRLPNVDLSKVHVRLPQKCEIATNLNVDAFLLQLSIFRDLNKDPGVHGIIVQMPLDSEQEVKNPNNR